jgi:WW domain
LTRFRFLALRKAGIEICTQSTWEVRFSNTRKVPYFFNTETQQSVWDPPEELTPEKIEKLPGAGLLKAKEVRASHILVKHSGSRRPSSWKEVSPTAFSSSPHPHNLPRLIDTIF